MMPRSSRPRRHGTKLWIRSMGSWQRVLRQTVHRGPFVNGMEEPVANSGCISRSNLRRRTYCRSIRIPSIKVTLLRHLTFQVHVKGEERFPRVVVALEGLPGKKHRVVVERHSFVWVEKHFATWTLVPRRVTVTNVAGHFPRAVLLRVGK